MRRGLFISIFLFLILLLAVGGCRKAGSWLVKKDHVEHADVMVMLSGTLVDRVLQTADLYHQNVAPRVLIVESGMGPDSLLEERGVHLISDSQLVYDILIQLGIPADRIAILPGGATSTMMEAEIVRDYLLSNAGARLMDFPGDQNHMDSILLVTSSQHTRRAYKLFSAALGPIRGQNEEAVVVLCSPSKYTDFHAERWWRSRNDIQKVVTEYMKLLNFVLFERRELRFHDSKSSHMCCTC